MKVTHQEVVSKTRKIIVGGSTRGAVLMAGRANLITDAQFVTNGDMGLTTVARHQEINRTNQEINQVNVGGQAHL